MKVKIILKKIYFLLLNLFFPRFCLSCGKPDSYLCEDCLALIDFPNVPQENIADLSKLYFASDYNHFLIKRLIRKFKYQPFAKDLATVFCLIIITYFLNLEKEPFFLSRKQECLLVPIPLFSKREKWRGFNQAEEIAKELSKSLNIPMNNLLIKNRKTANQADLSKEERKKNLKDVFSFANPEKREVIKGKIVLLIDDVFTTGATMSAAAQLLKSADASQVIGIVVARD